MTDSTDTSLDAIRHAVAALCSKFEGDYWRKLDRENAYPKEFVDEMTQSGFLACLIPSEFGGSGLGIREGSAILREIHRNGCNAGACHAQMYTMGTLLKHGSAEQKQRWLPDIASGAIRLQAFGVTEPTSGSETLALQTTAVRDGDDFVINGQKIWTSRAQHSDLMILLARTSPDSEKLPKGQCLSVFMVDMRDCEGLTIRPIRTMMNHATTEIFLDNVRVPAGNLIGEEGKGFRNILDGMNAERILIASECLGDAEWFIKKAAEYARERKVFGRPIGQNQGIQFPIARAHAQLKAASLVVARAAALFDSGQKCAEDANIGKLLASEASWAAAEACVQTFGGFAFAEEYDVERKFRETRLYQVAPISSNLVLTYVAEHVLAMPRSY